MRILVYTRHRSIDATIKFINGMFMFSVVQNIDTNSIWRYIQNCQIKRRMGARACGYSLVCIELHILKTDWCTPSLKWKRQKEKKTMSIFLFFSFRSLVSLLCIFLSSSIWILFWKELGAVRKEKREREYPKLMLIYFELALSVLILLCATISMMAKMVWYPMYLWCA